jgi:hypothetical protein
MELPSPHFCAPLMGARRNDVKPAVSVTNGCNKRLLSGVLGLASSHASRRRPATSGNGQVATTRDTRIVLEPIDAVAWLRCFGAAAAPS